MKKNAIISGLIALSVIGIITLWLVQENAPDSVSSPESPKPVTLLKVGFSTDWEYGSRKELKHKLPIQAVPELRKVVAYMNDVFQPDIVIGGGDYIESSTTKPEKAKAQLIEITDIFKEIRAPRYYALGNHDMRSLTKKEVINIIGSTDSHAIVDQGDWRLVIVDSNFNWGDQTDRNAENYIDGYLAHREQIWLDQALDTDRPVIVFSHHSPAPVFSQSTSKTLPEDAMRFPEEMRLILERHPNVVASVAGHTPRPQYRELAGIHYFVADTLVNEEALGSFSTIEAKWYPDERRAEILFEHYGPRRETYRASKVLAE